MISISADQVKKLRELTDASIMECREALQNSDGDMEKSRLYLRKKGKEKAQKKAGRETREGIIAAYVHSNKKIGALVEIRCETDFVAKNSEFQELAHDLAMHVAAMSPKYLTVKDIPKGEKLEEVCLFSQSFIKDPGLTVGDLIKEKISKIGENIQVEKFVRFEI